MESIQYAEVRALARSAGGAGRDECLQMSYLLRRKPALPGTCFRQRIWTDTHSKALGRGAAFHQNYCRVQSSSLTVVSSCYGYATVGTQRRGAIICKWPTCLPKKSAYVPSSCDWQSLAALGARRTKALGRLLTGQHHLQKRALTPVYARSNPPLSGLAWALADVWIGRAVLEHNPDAFAVSPFITPLDPSASLVAERPSIHSSDIARIFLLL